VTRGRWGKATLLKGDFLEAKVGGKRKKEREGWNFLTTGTGGGKEGKTGLGFKV